MSNFLEESKLTEQSLLDDDFDSFSQSELSENGSYHSSQITFEKSVSMIEFCIKSQIFTRDFINPPKVSKNLQAAMAEPDLVYTLLIGDTNVKTWQANDDQWEEESYVETLKGDKKKKKAKGTALVRNRRFQVPFEFQFLT